MPRQLVQDENVRGVITMNEEYETRFLCNSSKVRLRGPAPRPPPLYLAPDTGVPGFFFFASEELVLRLDGGRI